MASEEEDLEEEEECCDECGREMDDGEAEDGACYDCAGNIKADRVRRKIPSNYEVREVKGNHRKGCSDCGYSAWMGGEYYVQDRINPWGGDKFCFDCAGNRDWGGNNSDEDDDEDARTTAAFTMFPGHPTAGSLHIGGLSSAMTNPGMQKMTRGCTRVDTSNGRKCRGDIQSYTDAGFQYATCLVCFLPTIAAAEAAASNNEDKRKPSAERDGFSEGSGRNKRQRT
eukprot:scaffold2483_cov276-Chaetoceros_neogracile.AAC.10